MILIMSVTLSTSSETLDDEIERPFTGSRASYLLGLLSSFASFSITKRYTESVEVSIDLRVFFFPLSVHQLGKSAGQTLMPFGCSPLFAICLHLKALFGKSRGDGTRFVLKRGLRLPLDVTSRHALLRPLREVHSMFLPND